MRRKSINQSINQSKEQIKTNQIKSKQIKSNQIKSNQIKSNKTNKQLEEVLMVGGRKEAPGPAPEIVQ
jgi:hypothetical protein